jgi:VanZ family protein
MSYPHTWIAVGFSLLVSIFFVSATWLPSIALRIFGALAAIFNVTGLFLLSSVERTNASQSELPPAIVGLLIAGGTLTLAVLISAGVLPKGKRATGSFIVAAVLMASIVAYASSSEGGPSPMMAFLRNSLGLSAQAADLATIFIRKAIHFGFYGTFAVLIYLSARRSGLKGLTCLKVALLAALGLAAFDELRQSTADMRTGSVWDVALDVLGSYVSCTIVSATKRVRSM